MRVGILASHPVQYQAPWFRALAKHVDLTVYFAHRQSAQEQSEAGFGVAFDWDVDLTSGYNHRFLANVSKHPSVNYYSGCDTPEIAAIIAGKLKSENLKSGNDFGISESQRVSVSPFDAFIVMGWYLKSYMQAVRACRRAGIPVLARGDSQLRTPRSLVRRAAMEVRQRLLLRQFDGFLSPGKRHREYLRHFGVPAEKIFFSPHFVDNEFFREKAETLKPRKAEIRKEWGIPEDAFVPLFVGKFIPQKRPMDLVKAAQLLITDNSITNNQLLKLHLLFVGSGELGSALRANCNVVFDAEAVQRSENSDQRSERKSLTSDFRPLSSDFRSPTSDLRPLTSETKPCASFAGFLNQTEIPKAYVAADVLVLPSESETWGLTVNEAMACGLPVIVSDAVGCAPDMIDEGKTGFIHQLENVEVLAEKMELVWKLQHEGHDFRGASRVKAETYGLGVAVNGTLQALAESARCR